MRVSSTMHDDNWHSENPLPYLVEKGSNVTLTCTAKGPKAGKKYQPHEINWFFNSAHLETADCANGKPSPVKTCNLTLRWPHVRRGNYNCQAVNGMGCTYKELELKVAGESRLIQVSNYYYHYCYYYYYYYYCYCYCYYCYYYYYIIIIKGPMLTNFACIALRRWPGNIMKKHTKDLS